MAKLFLLRHLKSQWNKDDRFAGWVDNPLSDEGRAQAEGIAKILAPQKIDIAYSNALVRCLETVLRVYERIEGKYPLFLHLDGGKMQEWGNYTGDNMGEVPFYVTEKLNERYYGQVQGLNKAETKQKYGEELVQRWRRGYKDTAPGGETMEDTYHRVVPFFEESILKSLEADKNVLVVASHNSLRAIVKHIEHISDEDVAKLELPFGALVTYDFADGKFTPVK
jgi:2,3-bisphosphoglycerate-dependent phosphoglycerate mutase